MARRSSQLHDQTEVITSDTTSDVPMPMEESLHRGETADLSGVSVVDDVPEAEQNPFIRFGVIGLLIIAIASSGIAYYFYGRAKILKENPQKVAQEEVAAVVTQVGRLIVLPEGESPTLATVSDVERLKGQPFFAHAKNGDKVLIYTNARKAILYSPGQNKIIEVAPLNLGGQ